RSGCARGRAADARAPGTSHLTGALRDAGRDDPQAPPVHAAAEVEEAVVVVAGVAAAVHRRPEAADVVGREEARVRLAGLDLDLEGRVRRGARVADVAAVARERPQHGLLPAWRIQAVDLGLAVVEAQARADRRRRRVP